MTGRPLPSSSLFLLALTSLLQRVNGVLQRRAVDAVDVRGGFPRSLIPSLPQEVQGHTVSPLCPVGLPVVSSRSAGLVLGRFMQVGKWSSPPLSERSSL